MNEQLYFDFSGWLDNILQNELPSDIKAFNFNLYEDESGFQAELIGASMFDEYDEDWACEEVFDTRDNMFSLPKSEFTDSWEDAHEEFKQLINEYLSEGAYKSVLKSKTAVALGFVDAELEILFQQ